MLRFLKNHPFAVEAFFETSLVLTFAVPQQQLQNFIPARLELDTFRDQWAFVAVAMVQTRELRPKGFPKWLGNDFFLIGYRIFVRYTNKAGKRLRGLYILKSETDKKKMEYLGNLFTHYHYSTTDIDLQITGNKKVIQSGQSRLKVMIEQSDAEIDLPADSPFSDWQEARKFAGPLPFTFTYLAEEKAVLIIEGRRQNWQPEPVKITHCEFDFLDSLRLDGVVLANAFEIKNIPYEWRKGKTERWN